MSHTSHWNRLICKWFMAIWFFSCHLTGVEYSQVSHLWIVPFVFLVNNGSVYMPLVFRIFDLAYLNIKNHYTNICDLIIRAIMRAIIVFTVFVVILEKRQDNRTLTTLWVTSKMTKLPWNSLMSWTRLCISMIHLGSKKKWDSQTLSRKTLTQSKIFAKKKIIWSRTS